MSSNVLTPLELALEFSPLFKRHNTRVLFTGSEGAFFPVPGMSIYCASKAFLRHWVLAWSAEVTFSVGIFHPPAMSLPMELENRAKVKLNSPNDVAREFVCFMYSTGIEGYFTWTSWLTARLGALLPPRLLLLIIGLKFVRQPIK